MTVTNRASRSSHFVLAIRGGLGFGSRVMNTTTRTIKIVPLVEQARLFGVTLEQVKALVLRNAQSMIEMQVAAIKLEAKGKKHRSGMTAVEMGEHALAYFAAANS